MKHGVVIRVSKKLPVHHSLYTGPSRKYVSPNL